MYKLAAVVLAGLMIVLGLGGCEEGDAKRKQSGGSSYAVSGTTQKGPYLSGSSISIQELDNNLESNGDVHTTSTTNDLGEFDISSNINTRYVDIQADGFYFDEVSGGLSGAQLTLRSLADLNAQTTVNLNVLTHLERSRLAALYGSGMSFADARAQGKEEVLALFNIDGSGLADFQDMDVSQSGDSNAALLAASAILVQYATQRDPDAVTAELSQVLADLSGDLEDDGSISGSVHVSGLLTASQALDLATVRANLTARLADVGASGTVPDFEDFVDSDADGVLNRDDLDDDNDGLLDGDDPNPYVREAAWDPRANAPRGRTDATSAVLGGKIYVMGGDYDTTLSAVDVYDPISDTWSSAADLPAANSHGARSAAVLGGKIYVFGGLLQDDTMYIYDPDADSWSSATMPFRRWRHAVASVDGKAYVIAGIDEDAGGWVSQVNVFDPGGAPQWTTAAYLPGEPRAGLEAVALGGKIYVCGGVDERYDPATCYVYDPVADAWTAIADKPTGAFEMAGVALNGEVYFTGGFYDSAYSVVEVYNPATDTWRAVAELPFPRFKHNAAVADGRLFVLGGSGVSVDDVPDAYFKVLEYRPQFDFSGE